MVLVKNHEHGKSFTKRNVSHTLRVVKFGKQQTLKELLNNLWNSNLMETSVIIIGFQSACNNKNTIYGVREVEKR